MKDKDFTIYQQIRDQIEYLGEQDDEKGKKITIKTIMEMLERDFIEDKND